MGQNSSPKSDIASIVFLAILGFVLIIAVANFRVTGPGNSSPILGTNLLFTSSSTMSPNITQTVAAVVTYKANLEATYLATTRTPETPIYLPTGIYNDQRVKISAALLFIDAQNAWGGFIDGYRFALYAGALQSDPEQGVVGLVTSLPDGQRFEQFVTPSKHGSVRVVSELNNHITLIALDETIFYFDIPTRQFIDSITEVAPSVTPSPSSTPEPTTVPYPIPTELGTEAP